MVRVAAWTSQLFGFFVFFYIRYCILMQRSWQQLINDHLKHRECNMLSVLVWSVVHWPSVGVEILCLSQTLYNARLKTHGAVWLCQDCCEPVIFFVFFFFFFSSSSVTLIYPNILSVIGFIRMYYFVVLTWSSCVWSCEIAVTSKSIPTEWQP